jgi:hypothetical protein
METAADMYLWLGTRGGVGETPGGDAGLDRVRYRYRLLIYIFALEQEGVM